MAPCGSSDAERMLNLYLYDYMMRKNMPEAAENFRREVGFSPTTVGLDSTRGFLHDWWSFFYGIYESKQTEFQNRSNVQQDMHQSLVELVLSDPVLSSLFGDIGQYVSSNIQAQLVEQPQQIFSSEDHFRDLREKLLQNLREKLFEEELSSIYCDDVNAGPGSSNPMVHQNLTLPVSNLRGQDSQEKVMYQTSQNINENQDHDLPLAAPADESIGYTCSFDDRNEEAGVSGQRNMESSSVISGFTFKEVGYRSHGSKVLCCHFSSDGKFLVSAGQGTKVQSNVNRNLAQPEVLIWNTETSDSLSILGAHSCRISDVRFRPNTNIFATSSWDKDIRVWDAAQPANPPTTLFGHRGYIRSLDFNPQNTDILCSCDGDNDIRTWSVDRSACIHVSQRPTRLVRYQCGLGRLLATVKWNSIHLIDVETDAVVASLEGHIAYVSSVCWDAAGQYLATVSGESVQVWTPYDKQCIYKLLPASTSKPNNRFRSCIFHPAYPQCLIIGGSQTIQMWSPSSDQVFDAEPQEGLVLSLSDSQATQRIASASNETVKLWDISESDQPTDAV